MSQWPVRELGEVATVQMGQSPPGKTYNTAGDGLPFFQGKAEFGEDSPVAIKWCSQPLRIAEAGDVLLSVRAPVGPTNFATERCCIGRGLAAIRGKPTQCNQSYIRYFLRRFEVDIAARGIGSTFAAINRTDIERLQIPVPPLAEQERMVALLDEADELRKLRAQADRRTVDLIPALFHEMFGDPEHTDLPVKPLAELVLPDRPITYGILKPGPDIEGGIQYVRVLDIKQNRLHVHQLVRTSKAIAAQYKRSTLRSGDVLVSIRGTVGRTCIVPLELDGANITQDTARLAIISSVESRYVVEFINTPWAQNWMGRRILGQAVKGINLGDLRKLPVPVPPLSLQQEFAQRVTGIRAMEAEQAGSRKRLDDLFQAMLHRAFAPAGPL
jgi:type I restriction enzyme S subunit